MIVYKPQILGLDAVSLVTIGTGNGLSISSSQAISLALSSTSTTGALSDTDWNIFNNKEPAITVLPIAKGGTNNGSLAVTAGGVIYTDGTQLVNVGAGTSGQILQSNGASAPTWVSASAGGAPTVQKFTTGSGTYTLPSNVVYIRVRMVGGGGGGGGNPAGNGTAGGNTTFGSSLLVANGGAGGTGGTGAGGTGGTASLGTGPVGLAFAGGNGNPSINVLQFTAGGAGGASVFGGAGPGGTGNGGSQVNGVTAATNSGSGGGGQSGGGGVGASAGGGAGGYVDAIITSPASTYSYAVGAAGAGATGGGTGGEGLIIVEEYY